MNQRLPSISLPTLRDAEMHVNVRMLECMYLCIYIDTQERRHGEPPLQKRELLFTDLLTINWCLRHYFVH